MARALSSSAALAAKHRVAVIGSGNWGSVAAKIVAENTKAHPGLFETEVRMWTFEETVPLTAGAWAAGAGTAQLDAAAVVKAAKAMGADVSSAQATAMVVAADANKDGRASADELGAWNAAAAKAGKGAVTAKLTSVINKAHENTKYLAGIKLGANVLAVPSLADAARDADTLVVVTPHQFVERALETMRPVIAPNALAISLVKGMHVTPDGFHLISGLVSKALKVNCSVLMGANLATEVGLGQFSEATIGHKTAAEAERFHALFDRPYFRVTPIADVEGVEMCGTLKNVVALGAGFVDGLGLGNNSKAAIIRIGLMEMMALSEAFYPSVKTATFFESAGVADLITTCFGGRNRKCAEAYAKLGGGGKAVFDRVEAELLGGQKLQGVLTSDEVAEVLARRGMTDKFPLFRTINRICNGVIAPSKIVEFATLP